MKIHKIDARILEFLETDEKHTKEILDALSEIVYHLTMFKSPIFYQGLICRTCIFYAER